MPRLPVTVVAGFAGAGKSALIDRWLRARPAGERWAVLDNAAGASRPPAGFRRVAAGCACCTAQASARSAIIELLRAGPWERLLVELDGIAHPAAAIDLLRRAPLDAYLRVEAIVTVVDATRAAPFESVPMHPLASAQVEVATRIVLNRVDQADPVRAAALAQRLAEAPPFGRMVQPSADGAAAWLPGPDAAPAGWRARPASTDAAASHLDWRSPADQAFDRARLQALVAGWPQRQALRRGIGVFRTARDWYQWRFDGATASWEACAYRLDNRLELELAAPASGALIEALDADLAGARDPGPRSTGEAAGA